MTSYVNQNILVHLLLLLTWYYQTPLLKKIAHFSSYFSWHVSLKCVGELIKKCEVIQEPLALDRRVVWKISKRHFFSRYQKILLMGNLNGSRTTPIFFPNFFLTNIIARGVQSFCILEGATDPLIDQWLIFFINLAQTHDEQMLKHHALNPIIKAEKILPQIFWDKAHYSNFG